MGKIWWGEDFVLILVGLGKGGAQNLKGRGWEQGCLKNSKPACLRGHQKERGEQYQGKGRLITGAKDV